MWHRLRMLWLDFWKRWWPGVEIQNTILPEQLEYKQPELVEIELSTVTSESRQTVPHDIYPDSPTTKHLRISIPRELGQSV